MTEDEDDHDECSCAEDSDSADSGEVPVVLQPERTRPGLLVYRLLPRTSFSWGNIVAKETLQFQIPRYVPIEVADEAQLVLRVHEGAGNGGGAIDVAAESVSFSCDDPETVFVATRAAATIQIPADGTSGFCVTKQLRGDLGGYIRLVLTFTRTGLAVDNSAALSADLVVRTAVDSAEREDGSCARA